MTLFFYDIDSLSERLFLPKILERVYSYQRDQRICVFLSTLEEAELVDGWLWTYESGSFLPHILCSESVEEARLFDIFPINLYDASVNEVSSAIDRAKTIDKVDKSTSGSCGSEALTHVFVFMCIPCEECLILLDKMKFFINDIFFIFGRRNSVLLQKMRSVWSFFKEKSCYCMTYWCYCFQTGSWSEKTFLPFQI